MPHKTSIEWTRTELPDGSFTEGYASNPIRARRLDNGKVGWHCEKVSPGCVRCYAETVNLRFGTGLPFTPASAEKIELFVSQDELNQYKALNDRLGKQGKTAKVFAVDMADIFHRMVTDAMLNKVFDTFEACPNLTTMILTKRANRMAGYLTKRWAGKTPPAHIWGGVSVERQEEAWRIRHLIETPLALRFLSCEPLLSRLDINQYLTRIGWAITGGESGVKARPANPDWFRDLRDQCKAAGVPFFMKQMGGRKDKGGDIETIPADLRIRQMPEVTHV
ncbi:MAG: DUF5131 family protein [Acidobacteriota bacterium]